MTICYKEKKKDMLLSAYHCLAYTGWDSLYTRWWQVKTRVLSICSSLSTHQPYCQIHPPKCNSIDDGARIGSASSMLIWFFLHPAVVQHVRNHDRNFFFLGEKIARYSKKREVFIKLPQNVHSACNSNSGTWAILGQSFPIPFLHRFSSLGQW